MASSNRWLATAASFLLATLPALAGVSNITLTATSHDFVSVPEGTQVQYGIQLTNNTTSAFPFSMALTGSAQYTQNNGCGTSVAAGAKCEIIFTYTAPSNSSEYDTATFTIATQGDTFSPGNSGTLTAHSVPGGVVTLNSNKHNFGAVVLNSTAMFGLNVSNGTSSAMTFTGTPSGDTTHFKISSNNCTTTVKAGAQCEVVFSFTPTTTASVTYTLPFTSSTGATVTPASPITLVGSGVSATGTLQLSTTAHNFIQVAQGTTSPVYGTVLTNNTTATVKLATALADGTNFKLSATTCGPTLASGAHCDLSFTFTPAGINFISTLYSITATNASTNAAVPLYLGSTSTTASGVALKGIGEGLAPEKSVIYQIVTDRFFDGDTTNDNPSESPGLYDSTQTNWQAYWGGDLAGIQQKLSYIEGMNPSALWVSPEVNNNNLNQNSGTPISASYHGYDARDFMNVEEHFGDNSNSFTAFSSLTTAMHQGGIKMILDWANNHSNYTGGGEMGALYNNGTFMGSSSNDPNNLFHHYADIGNYNDRYQLQYYTLSDLLDIDQTNSTMDAYLKTAVNQFQQNGIDGLRLDAIKHVNWGWEYSFANNVFTYGQTVNNPSPFLYGEWYSEGPGDVFWADETKFANRSGINELDFGVNQAVRDVFGSNNNFSEIEDTINSEDTGANTTTFPSTGGYFFTYPNDLVTFFDSQDENRLYQNVTTDINRVNEAMAYILTERGVPIILYGDEQYLYNTTNSGNDPYNRVAMTSFSTSTTAYQVVSKLAALRKTNNAIGFGSHLQRYVTNDLYVYERQFGSSIVLVAINKNATTVQGTSGLLTNLPAGTYTDYLGGLLGGVSLTVSGTGNNKSTNAPSIPAESVSVWVYTAAATTPIIGSVSPHAAQPGVQVTVYGDGFGSSTGSVQINGTTAPVVAWGNNFVVATVPSTSYTTVGSYSTTVQVTNSGGTASSTYPFQVLTANLVPVTFTVTNACTTSGDNIFMTGNTPETGNWSTNFQGAVGPMLTGNGSNTGEAVYSSWSLTTSLPAGQNIQFKFIDIKASTGTTDYEGGSNRTYTVPASGVGTYTGAWQNSSCPSSE